jgi:hypothetical protein
VFAGFALTALNGTAVEPRTAVALPLRATVWLVIAWVAGRRA